jgi:hypothetical protein
MCISPVRASERPEGTIFSQPARRRFSAAPISARDIIEAQATCPALVLAPNRGIGSVTGSQSLRNRPGLGEAQRGAEEKAGDATGGLAMRIGGHRMSRMGVSGPM